MAQRDRWIATVYQKHFDLGKTRCATTDYVTGKVTVDVCNRIDYVANDWHRLVDKLAIFIQRWCAFFCSVKSLFFHGCKFFVAGLNCERCKHLRKCKWWWKQTMLILRWSNNNVIHGSQRQYFFHKTKVVRLGKRELCSCWV